MSRARMASLALIITIVLIAVGCSSATQPDSANRAGQGVSGNEPARLKVGDTSIDVPKADPSAAGAGARSPDELQRRLEMFLDVLNLVDQEFYDNDAVDYGKMVQGAIKGMLESLGDEETTFSDAPSTKIAEEDLRGAFAGIGVTVELKNKRLTVLSPLDDTPGAKAGLRAGDVIVSVDGKDTGNMSLGEAVSLIRGTPGTTVRLVVEREGESRLLAFAIVRSTINVVTVKAQMMGDVAYLKINQFAEPTAALFRDRLGELMANKPKAVILDLRNNPGGLLGPAVEVASQFLGDGVVLHERRRGGQQPINAQPGGLAINVPMIVLINKGSASAAEIVAGALKDHGRAVLLGERTFGKDTVQSVHRLADGSTVSITVARWYTPNKQDIAGNGLAPDLAVSLTEADARAGRDPQLERALEWAKTGR